MSTKLYIKIALNIFMIFAVIILCSYGTDHIHEQLGDLHCNGATYDHVSKEAIGCQYTGYSHEPTYHYGFRHYMVICMGVAMFILNVIRIGYIINNSTNDKEKN